MIFNNLTSVPKQEFAPWIKRVPGRDGGARVGATVVFPHAGAAAAGYRTLAHCVGRRRRHLHRAVPAAGRPADANLPPKPSMTSPAVCSRPDHGATWRRCGCSVTAWAPSLPSSSPGSPNRAVPRWNGCGYRRPGTVRRCRYARTADQRRRTTRRYRRPRRDRSRAACRRRVRRAADHRGAGRLPSDQPLHRDPTSASCADIHVLGARDDHRVDVAALRLWENHTAGSFELSFYDGGHFYVDEHIDAVAARVNADV